MLFLPAIAALLVQAAAPDTNLAARNPAYSRDGRLAVSVRGDLWVVSRSGQWTSVTTGPAWDREPTWTPDGSAIVFSSDRSGNFDLWRIPVSTNGIPGAAEQLTASPLPEGQPAVGRDGTIYFVRGRLGAATLWMRQASGVEARATKDRAVEQWPVMSLDGSRLAWVSTADGTRKLPHPDARHGARHDRAHRSTHRTPGLVAGRRPPVVVGGGAGGGGVCHAD